MKNENKKMILEGIKEKREGKDFKIGFWNVAGLKNKDGDFLKNLKKWDVIFSTLVEIWLDKEK